MNELIEKSLTVRKLQKDASMRTINQTNVIKSLNTK